MEKFSELKKFIEIKNNDFVNIVFSRDGKIKDVNVKVVEKKLALEEPLKIKN